RMTYERDDRGRVAEVRDGEGELLLTVHRDEVGRIARRVYADRTEVRYGWGEQSQLIEAEDSTCVLKLEWTPGMQIASEQVGDHSCNYKYDAVGNRTLLMTSAGREIRYRWDARNRLVEMDDVGRARYEFAYNNANLFTNWICPSSIQGFEFD